MPKGIYKIFRTPQEFKCNNDAHFNLGVDVGIQLGIDMAYAALGRKSTNFREKWFDEFIPILGKVIEEYGEIMDADVVDDPEMWYATSKLDQELMKYTGKNHIPWNLRYLRFSSNGGSKK